MTTPEVGNCQVNTVSVHPALSARIQERMFCESFQGLVKQALFPFTTPSYHIVRFSGVPEGGLFEVVCESVNLIEGFDWMAGFILRFIKQADVLLRPVEVETANPKMEKALRGTVQGFSLFGWRPRGRGRTGRLRRAP
jgi:hypothetical protein